MVIDVLLKSNRRYATDFEKSGLSLPPAHQVAVVACMDARLNLFAILGLNEGDAHVIRNAGGVVTEDTIRSLVLSQRLLGTREIMLIHHTDCGMLTFTDDEVKTKIQVETGLRPPFALEAFADVEEDVRQSIRRVHANPFIVHRNRVRGFIYDVRTGRLREVAAAEPGRPRRRVTNHIS